MLDLDEESEEDKNDIETGLNYYRSYSDSPLNRSYTSTSIPSPISTSTPASEDSEEVGADDEVNDEVGGGSGITLDLKSLENGGDSMGDDMHALSSISMTSNITSSTGCNLRPTVTKSDKFGNGAVVNPVGAVVNPVGAADANDTHEEDDFILLSNTYTNKSK